MAQKNNNTGVGAGTGMGIAAALAAAAAGAYYFYGAKDAAKNRKTMKGWMVKAKGEIMEQMENLKDISQDRYDAIVDKVTGKYKKLKNVDPRELATMASELKGHWDRISAGSVKPAKKPATKK